MGIVAGWACDGAAMKPNVGARTTVTKKVYDFLGSLPVKSSNPANSLLLPKTILLSKDFRETDDELRMLQKAYEKYKTQFLLDNVIICILHEDDTERTRHLANIIHARFPGIRVTLKGIFPSKDLQMYVDVYIPSEATLTDHELKDCERLQLLRDCIEAVRHRKHQKRYASLLNKAEKILADYEGIVGDFKQPIANPKKLDNLIAKFVPLTEPFEKWDKGAMSLSRAIEVRIARQTARQRSALHERHLKACEVFNTKSLSQKDWDALWPKRVLFSQDFEGPPTKAHDWDGKIVTYNVPKGSNRALAGRPDNKYFARRTRTGIYYDNARATTTTWVTFHYFINKRTPIGVFVFNMTQGDNCRYKIPNPVVGKWAEVTIQVGGGQERIRSGEALDDIFIHAGKPIDKDLELIVDNVRLIGLD
jgi:hypothetical protein